MPDGLKAGEPMRSVIENLTEEELDMLIGSVLYYVGIHPDKMHQDMEMPRHEMLGGVRMALRRLFKCDPATIAKKNYGREDTTGQE